MSLQTKDNMESIKNKINQTLTNIKSKLGPKLILIDNKFSSFMPNVKLRNIVYITMLSLIGFMLLIIILGLLLSPLRNNRVQTGFTLKKPNIVNGTPLPAVSMSATQSKLLELEKQINNLKFPDSSVNVPVIEFEIKI